MLPSISTPKVCLLCFEPGAIRRTCCRAAYCDHCYVKNNKCPNCHIQTKRESLTGATYQLKIFSEHEECRVCLDPGLLRRCCGNYYCDTCYYKDALCRSCHTPVTNIKGDKQNLFMDRALCITVTLGWLVTVFVAVVAIIFTGFVIAADVATPVGISHYRCYGFFRSCDVSVCVEMEASNANGTAALPPISTWKKCDLDSLYKMESKACIFDQNLYHQSDRQLGYDVCASEFNQGIYVFEDTFESWAVLTDFETNAMQSAHWANLTNAQTDSYCGAGEIFGGEKSLRFGGEFLRFAETEDMDVSSGGKLEYEMFLPPIGNDAFSSFCKTGYIGTVMVEYSINQGQNWTTLAEFPPALYRAKTFVLRSHVLPKRAVTTQTRFKFHQPIFEAARDNWALDNVRVLRDLPSDWSTAPEYVSNVRTGRQEMQQGQCCADTDWCNKRISAQERQQCNDFDWYDNSKYLFRLSEIFLCVVVLINVLRFLYLTGFDYLVREKIPFHDEVFFFLSIPMVKKYLLFLPPNWRPDLLLHSSENSEIASIHRAARLEAKLRKQFDEDENEADGLMLKKKEVAEKERREILKKVKVQVKKLKKRQAKKNFKASTIVIDEQKEMQEQLKTYVLPEPNEGGLLSLPDSDEGVKYAQDILLSEAEKLRRQNLALLRIPFDLEQDKRWRHGFAATLLIVTMAFFFVELSRTPNYAIYTPIVSFGTLKSTFYANSVLIIFFALYCDIKEIYYLVKYVVPLSPRITPPLTLDLSDDQRNLFIGDYTVPISQIREIVAFPAQFSYFLAAGVVLGGFPWCLFSLLLRETELSHGSMRFVTPLLGCVMIIRATTGPLFVVKLGFTLHCLFDLSFPMRERIGQAVQKEANWHMALNVALGFMVLGALFTAVVAAQWEFIVVPAGILGGGVYGMFTGTAHFLPLKPWLYLTTLRSGVYLHVRKKQRCPCLYWGRYCTAMHEYDEVLVLFSEDDVKFTSIIHNGISAVEAFQKV